MTPEQFIRKWTASTLSERSAAQQHFIDLCNLLGEPAPADADPTGETYTFEKGGTTATGGKGWADVWRRGVFAWEYKGPGKDLTAAYLQLKKYADMLENPPLLIVSDTKRIEVHTNFTNTVKIVHVFEIADLSDPAKRETLRAAFSAPEKLRPGITRQQVTTEAAQKFSQLAHALGAKGYEPQRVAHFLNRLIFCMFAEDVGLLPNRLFTKLVVASVAHPETFQEHARQLFAGMAKGGSVAFEVIDWFNGGLFDDDATLPLNVSELKNVLQCAELDWSNIEPSIFGTLFERGLDPDKRSQQGAHYTDPETILKIVRPVVLEPWQREWEQEKLELAKQIERARKTVSEAAKRRYFAFLERLHQFRVLDPACGSGNFLYLALRGLKDLEKRVILEAEALGLPLQFPRVGPEAVLGIEVNSYAAELARVTIWIGEIQWMIENGFTAARNPILKPLNQIECRDAVVNADGSEPDWPKADVVVGNPPFLGAKLMYRSLGREYTQRLRACYEGRLTGFTDLVCYWFEKAHESMKAGKVRRVGLVATNSIAKNTNLPVMRKIATEHVIFRAWRDEPWILDGAAVRVSIICFAPREAVTDVQLDGKVVEKINADLTSGTDVSDLRRIAQNSDVSFLGIQKSGPLDVSGTKARDWMALPVNPNGQKNSGVLKPFWNGDDLTGRPRDQWLIDMPHGLNERDAALYEAPFEYLRTARYDPDDAEDIRTLREVRAEARDEHAAKFWWEPYWPRPEMRQHIARLERYLVTPETSEHRLFVWLKYPVLPDKNLIVIARDDDVTFGILQSRMHEVWSTRIGNRIGQGNQRRYNSSYIFETFPFPAGLSPDRQAGTYAADPRAVQIAAAAKRLHDAREAWLNPADLVQRLPEVAAGFPDRIVAKNVISAASLRKRTLTELYNENPKWLQLAHAELDEAVAAAYGWTWPLADDEILNRLFSLNQERTDSTTLVAPT